MTDSTKSHQDRLADALDQVQPDWMTRFCSLQQLQSLARLQGDSPPRVQARLKAVRSSTAFDLMQVVRAAIIADIVK